MIGLFDLLDGDWHGIDRTGAAMLVPTLAYAGLAVVTFPQPRLRRSVSTVLWSAALVVGAIATALLLGGTPLSLVWAAVAVLLAWLSRRTGEARLQIGAAAYVVLAAGHALVRDAPPTDFFESSRHPAAGAGAVAAAAVAALAMALRAEGAGRLEATRGREPVLAVAGVLAAYRGVARPPRALRVRGRAWNCSTSSTDTLRSAPSGACSRSFSSTSA